MNSKSSTILVASAFLTSTLPSQLIGKEAQVEVRRAASAADTRLSRGADDVAANANGTPHVRQSRGVDDAAINANGTPHIRQGRGADDIAVNADGTPHVRQSRGADDFIATAAGALVPTAAALMAPGPPKQGSSSESLAVFGAPAQPALTQGLTPQAIHRSNEKLSLLEVNVVGYVNGPHTAIADLENGEVMGNLPNKERLLFALYESAQQAQAAAALWAAPAAETTRADGALVAVETGIITWKADDGGQHGPGSIHGLFLRSERMPELTAAYLRGKVIQIYGPQTHPQDNAAGALPGTRQVFWTSAPMR